MSFLTHLVTALAGGLLAGMGLAAANADRGEIAIIGAVFGVCHLLPDIEYLLRKKGTLSQLTQRGGMTHSLLFALVVPWFVAAIALGGGVESYLRAAAAGVLGYVTHILLDLMSPYPVTVLWPWKRRFCLGLLYFNDYGLILMLALAGFFFGAPQIALAIIGVFLVLYVGMRLGFLIYARSRFAFFKAPLGRETIEEIAWIPDSFEPWVWKVAIRTNESFHAWNLNLLTNINSNKYKVSRREAGLLRRARAVQLIRELDEFSPFFCLDESEPDEKGRVKVTGHDIRWHYYGKENPLRVELTYDGNKLIETVMF